MIQFIFFLNEFTSKLPSWDDYAEMSKVWRFEYSRDILHVIWHVILTVIGKNIWRKIINLWYKYQKQTMWTVNNQKNKYPKIQYIKTNVNATKTL